MKIYRSLYRQSLADREGFWGEAAAAIDWHKPYEKVFDESLGVYGHWFSGGRCNTSYNCLDRHVAQRGDQKALIYDSPVTKSQKSYTYRELRDEVAAFAAVLQKLGVVKGDRVIIYMPMIPQALIAMLATARIGAIHAVVFGGFAANELATRINDAEPKLIVSASCGIEPNRTIAYKELLDQAVDMAIHKPTGTVIYQRSQLKAQLKEGFDYDWDVELQEMKDGKQEADPVFVGATDPLYILYTSGTTGVPKGVVRDTGGHMVALHWSMKNVYNIDAGDVFWAASDVGWVVGHSYICYGPLLCGATTIIYEGKPVGTPDAGAFWRVIQDYKVKSLFTAPTALRAIMKEDPSGELLQDYDLSHFEALFLAGERADANTIVWSQDKLQVPVIDHWWQTETGWAIAANPLGVELLPVKPGSPTVPMPGYDVQVLDEAGSSVAPGETGAIAIALPLPPSCLPSLWKNDAKFRESYLATFPGFYETSDAGYLDEDGYVFVMARTDDIINVAGHRLSTGGIEEAIGSHERVAECAVVGLKDNLKGELPFGFIVLNKGDIDAPDEVMREIVSIVREKIGPVAAFKKMVIVERLPKTRSGKILRKTLRAIGNGETFQIPATIDDPIILDEIKAVLAL